MSGRLSEKTKEKFIRSIEKLVIFDKARMKLMYDDEPDVTPQVGEHRELLLLGQRGDFNFHLWLVQEMSRIKTRLNRKGWNGLTKRERSIIRETAWLADIDFNSNNSFRAFSERSLAIAERYFEMEIQPKEGKTKDE